MSINAHRETVNKMDYLNILPRTRSHDERVSKNESKTKGHNLVNVKILIYQKGVIRLLKTMVKAIEVQRLKNFKMK